MLSSDQKSSCVEAEAARLLKEREAIAAELCDCTLCDQIATLLRSCIVELARVRTALDEARPSEPEIIEHDTASRLQELYADPKFMASYRRQMRAGYRALTRAALITIIHNIKDRTEQAEADRSALQQQIRSLVKAMRRHEEELFESGALCCAETRRADANQLALVLSSVDRVTDG